MKVKRRIKESAGKPVAIDMSIYINRRRTQTVPKVICTDRKRGCLKSKRRKKKGECPHLFSFGPAQSVIDNHLWLWLPDFA
jgi:hypothetical protein